MKILQQKIKILPLKTNDDLGATRSHRKGGQFPMT